MIKYVVWVNDDRFVVYSKVRMTLEDIAEHLDIEVDEIVMLDIE